MLPTTHATIGYLIYAKKNPKLALLAALGALSPDFFGVMVYAWIFARRLWGLSFGLDFSFYAEAIFGGSLHSVFFWIAVSLTLFFVPKLKPFVIGGWSHILFDLITHVNPYAWNHLYPLAIRPIDGVLYYRSWVFFFIVDIPLYLILAIVCFYQFKPNKGAITSKIFR